MRALFQRSSSTPFRLFHPRHSSTTAGIPIPTTSSPAAIITEALTKKVGNSGTGAAAFSPPKLTAKEKFRLFWKHLYNDYKDVFVETFQDAKAKPLKASIYLSLAGGILYAYHTNPTEYGYISELTRYDTDVSFISTAIRNPNAEKYAHNLLKSKMKGELRYQNFELLSIVWKHDADKKTGIYESQCKYLKPLWAEVTERFVDIGIFGRFWMLERKMLDYDVNPYEWDEEVKIIASEGKEQKYS